MAERLVGVLEKIVWSNEDTHFTIAEIHCEGSDVFGGDVTIKGILPGVQCGETLELEGEWISDRKYGRQFNVKTFKSKLPASVHGIRKYLSSKFVEGIGKTYANRIVDRFGADTFRIISEEAGRLREIKGISDQRILRIRRAWDRHRRLHEIFSEMQIYGINISQCSKILDRYGDATMKTIRANPYRLAYDIRGIAFPTADKIARNMGLGNENPYRIDAGIFYTLEEIESEGHTAAPCAFLRERAVEKLDVPATLVTAALEILVQKGKLRIFGGQSALHDESLLLRPSLDLAEKEIADCIARIREASGRLPAIKVEIALAWAQDRAGFDFAPEQMAAIRAALLEKFSVITGGPGTGKTTILSALCAILKAKKTTIMLAAPTGRAAQRMAEATGVPAQTIHRMLNIGAGTRKDSDEELRELIAGGNEEESEDFLKADFVIIDEASMLDASLAAQLLRRIAPETHLVLVGDVHQLPSIGAGNVLSDIIRSGTVATTTLQAVFRQGSRSGIVTTAHNILRGVTTPPPEVLSFGEIDTGRDIFFLPCESPEETKRKVLELATKVIPKLFAVDPVNDIQILTAMHKGEVGVQALNAYLQKAYKNIPAENATISQHLEQGDKVIQTRNNYEKSVFNGDMGTVASIDKETGTVVVKFDKATAEYTKNEAQSELQLAYAITIHKSQGSEFPVVIVPLVKGQFMMLRRNLIYTAITRGRKKVFVVGQSGAYFMAVKNVEATRRITTLRERLCR
ncbi:MAG: ATP-dependent RecD-like DNA helicase [Opitutales bacterium]|nr:ATP-dependent RecD-like DNA helicase [Opitutales bacterium]